MGIDGIGKPPSPPAGVGGPSGASGTGGTGASFSALGTSSTAPTTSTELGRLGRGEISLDDYLDARVADATQHLVGKLSPEQLEFVRSTVRSELETDPVLIELVRRATGQSI